MSRIIKTLGICTLLFGLALIEYGCQDRYQGGDYSYGTIVGLRETKLFQIDSLGNLNKTVQDSVPWDSFVLVNTFEVSYASLSRFQNFSAVADPAPPPSLSLRLDSIQIWNVAVDDSMNTTSSFDMQIGRWTNYSFPITNDHTFRQEANYEVYSSEYEHLFYMTSPIDADILQIRVRYFTESGEIFESLSEPFKLTT